MKTLFSGIQPSGNLHIGNYIGAISQWTEIQKNYNCILCVVDYHAITVKQDPKTLNKTILDLARIYLAAGIDPKKAIIFQQSDVTEHTELGWILSTITKVSELEKMTQFKDKTKNQGKEGPSVGLFNYPTLMAADVLLYNTDVVPVGEDQTQHLEITRALARRFNNEFGQTFKVPETIVRKEGARIMSLDDPTKKMSKSSKIPNSYIALLDEPTVAHKKIKRAVTDSGNEVRYDLKNKAAISNLLTIYSVLAKKSVKELELLYENKNYGEFKEDLANLVANFLEDFQAKYKKYSDKDVRKILDNGAKQAKKIAEKTIKLVKHNLGVN
ncbi:MAG: tryptophan--tRNA ligase [Candidatus Falkowbacteria bacterium]|nr:tryptophan--tRNA ligase [Candidatus Falkowbacteria bacterium]